MFSFMGFCVFFSQMYSGDSHPMCPHSVLVAMWKYADYLAGYEQQDAHEFLMGALNGVHHACAGELESGGRCDCVVHQIFGGLLESSVTCQSCQNVSTVHDPIIDLSMEISSLLGAPPLSTDLDASLLGSPLSPAFLPEGEKPSLVDCLRRYTRTERLAETERVFCPRCNTNTMGRKRLCFLELPQVLCLHLKVSFPSLCCVAHGGWMVMRDGLSAAVPRATITAFRAQLGGRKGAEPAHPFSHHWPGHGALPEARATNRVWGFLSPLLFYFLSLFRARLSS